MVWNHQGLAHRPAVTGMNGVVASAHPLASLAGLRIMLQGGNAIDAAVATAAALNVVEPFMSGAGGVGYMNITPAGASEPVILDYIGRAPAAATPDMFTQPGGKDDGIQSPLVPGALGGWLMALERYGTLDRATVFAPAIELAERGFAMTIKGNWFFGTSRDRLRNWATSSEAYLHNGETPRPGAIVKQPNLARTFRTIVEEGADAFYKGSIAREIARFSQENGGLLTEEDLATYQPSWTTPISVNYRGYDIYAPPLPCSAMQYLQTLKICEGFDMAGMGHNSIEYIHHLAEAMKLAVADRTTYAPDESAPIDKLLSDDYLAARRALIDPDKAALSGGERYNSSLQANQVQPGSVESILKESTTHFVAADAAGNVVSCTQTLGGGFGSGVVHGSTGLALNNFAHWFDLDPESPNVIAPNKRVEMCLAPSQTWRDGKPCLAVGTPGSFGIMQTTPQMIMNVIDHDFSIQAAIEAPRFRTNNNAELPMEGRIPESVREGLQRKGHEVQVMDDWTMFVGGGQGFMIDPETGAFFGGADPRRDGYALAF